MYEYKTTHGSGVSFFEGSVEVEPDDPTPPDGEGWELVAMAATPNRLYWAWKRTTPQKPW